MPEIDPDEVQAPSTVSKLEPDRDGGIRGKSIPNKVQGVANQAALLRCNAGACMEWGGTMMGWRVGITWTYDQSKTKHPMTLRQSQVVPARDTVRGAVVVAVYVYQMLLVVPAPRDVSNGSWVAPVVKPLVGTP